MEKSIINVEDVRFSYITAEGVAPIVLDGVTLDIEEGSFVAVLGHNGSGKSTLAKHMNAILLPTGGKVYVGSRTRTTRSWPTWWRRTWPSPRRTWGCPRRRSAVGWTTH